MGKILKRSEDVYEFMNKDGAQVYPMDGIKVEKGFYTVFELKRRYDDANRRIVLDSDFQREDVWGIDRKAELVESVIMGLPLPVFYFNQDKYGRLIVVDGRQRLTALFDYMDDRFTLRKLKIFPELNSKKFTELSPVLRGRIEDFQIQAHVILPPTPDRIKFDIFDRVNRGGMKLNKQEMRNALYQGAATQMLNEIVCSEAFINATGNAFEKEKRMKDKYLITRFVAIYLVCCGKIIDDNGERYVYRNDVDEMLGKGMDLINSMLPEEVTDLKHTILELLDKSYDYLGKDAFRISRGERKSPINMNVFETVMFAMCFIPKRKETIRKKVRESIFNLIDSEEFRMNIGNHRDSAAKIYWRLEQAQRIGRSFE